MLLTPAMTVPRAYLHASRDFDAFMLDARDSLGLSTTHQAFTVMQAVFWVFRRRLEAFDAIAFAQALPPVLAAIFLQDWNPAEPAAPFGDMTRMNREVQTICRDHNMAPDNAIGLVGAVVHRHVDRADLDSVLLTLPPDAAAFWKVTE